MLKRNLIVIAIMSLIVVLTGNAFGQWHPDIDRVKGKTPVKTKSIKSPRDVATGQATGKRKGTKTVQSGGNENKLGNFEIQSVQKIPAKQVGGDVHPGQDGMGGTGMVKQSSSSTSTQRTGKPNRKKPFFRPNPTGDGTTQQVYGDVHPGEGDMGTGMVKGRTPNSNSRRKRPAPIKPANGPRVKPKGGFMDYTDDAAMTQIQPGQNSGGTLTNQIKNGSKDKTKVVRNAATGRSTGRRQHKP